MSDKEFFQLSNVNKIIKTEMFFQLDVCVQVLGWQKYTPLK